ncbi:hypothetical protein ACFX1R_006423 [Malus domestica]
MLFDDKRFLCDRVFASSASINESCFTHISGKATNLLFGFPQVLMTVKSKKNSSSSELDNSCSFALHQLVMLLHLGRAPAVVVSPPSSHPIFFSHSALLYLFSLIIEDIHGFHSS